MARFPMNDRILTCDDREIEFPGDFDGISLSDTFFTSLDEEFEGSSNSIEDTIYGENINNTNEEDDDEEEEQKQYNVKIPRFSFLWTPYEFSTPIYFQPISFDFQDFIFPAEDIFLEVPDTSNPEKIEMTISLKYNYVGEFQTIKASGDYDRVLKKILQGDVAKIENLLSITKLLCLAANKRMKEKNMQHRSPTRKHRYTQAQWHTTSKRTKSSSLGRRKV